jgi:hypothetical protein
MFCSIESELVMIVLYITVSQRDKKKEEKLRTGRKSDLHPQPENAKHSEKSNQAPTICGQLTQSRYLLTGTRSEPAEEDCCWTCVTTGIRGGGTVGVG